MPLIILAGVVLALMSIFRPGHDASLQADRRAETASRLFRRLSGDLRGNRPRSGLYRPAPLSIRGTGLRRADRHWISTGCWRGWKAGPLPPPSGSLSWRAAAGLERGGLVRLHPQGQYLFYNHLVGGLEGAARRYETDYWVNIMPEAVDDLEAFVANLIAGNPRAATWWRSAASGCRSEERAIRGCDGLRTGTKRTSSSRRRTARSTAR